MNDETRKNLIKQEPMNNFMELAKKACLSQQTITIDLKDANILLTAVLNTLLRVQGLDVTCSEYFEEYDRAKEIICLECLNCGEFSYKAKTSFYFFSDEGAASTLGNLITIGSNIGSSRRMCCPGCNGTKAKATFKIVTNLEDEIQKTKELILEKIKNHIPIENVLPGIHIKDSKVLGNALMHLDCISTPEKSLLFKNLELDVIFHILRYFDDSNVINIVQQLEQKKKNEIIAKFSFTKRDYLDFRTRSEKEKEERKKRKEDEELKAKKDYDVLVQKIFKNIETKGYKCSHCQEQNNFKLSTGEKSLIICRKCGHVVDCDVSKRFFSLLNLLQSEGKNAFEMITNMLAFKEDLHFKRYDKDYNKFVGKVFSCIKAMGFICGHCQEKNNFKLSAGGKSLIICRKCGHIVDCNEFVEFLSFLDKWQSGYKDIWEQ